jgi:hypothetical protein
MSESTKSTTTTTRSRRRGSTTTNSAEKMTTTTAATDPPPGDLVITEKLISEIPDKVQEALRASNGHVAIAADALGMSVSRLDRIVRMSKQIKGFLGELRRAKVTSAWEGILIEQLEKDIAYRAAVYRSEALDAIHDLAVMKIDDNSAQNQVKLAAAIKLYGATESAMGSEVDSILQALNAQYRENAPRIRMVRERVSIELQGGENAPVLVNPDPAEESTAPRTPANG